MTDLVEQLRRSAALADPLPDSVVRLARTAFAWSGEDVVVAAVSHDSATGEPATTRSGGDTRLLELTASGVTVALEVADAGSSRAVTGHVHPAEVTALRHRQPDGTSTSVDVDGLGRFVMDGVARGPFSLAVEVAGAVVATDWVLL